MLTLRQFANAQRRAYALENGITLKEMREYQPDNWYATEHLAYIEREAKAGVVFTKRFLDRYYAAYGGNALRLFMKFHPNSTPEYYVHPDCR